MKIIFTALFMVFVLMNPAMAQSSANLPVLEKILLEKDNYPKINQMLGQIEKKLQAHEINVKDTVEYIKSLSETEDYVIKSKAVDEEALNTVQKKLEALGEAPADGVKEAADIAKNRKAFTLESNAIRARIADADLIVTKIDELTGLILNLRNQKLLTTIFAKESSIFHPQEFVTSMSSFAGLFYDIIKSPVVWYESLDANQRVRVHKQLAMIFMAMIGCLMVGAVLRYLIRKKLGYHRLITNPGYGQKVVAALWMWVAYGVIPAAIIGMFLAWLNRNTLLDVGNFGIFLKLAATYLLYIFLFQALVRVTIAADHSRWRLIEVSDEKARSLNRSILFSIVALCIMSFFSMMAKKMDYSSDVIYSLRILFNAVRALCILLVAKSFLYDEKPLSDEEIKNAGMNDEDLKELSLSSKIYIYLFVLTVGAFGLSLFGYLKLSEYILSRFISSVLIVGFFYIVNKLMKVIFHHIIHVKYFTKTLRVKKKTLEKADFWFGFVINPIIAFFACLFLLGLWGVSVDIMLQYAKRFLIGFNIGDVHVSIGSILLGVVAFFVSLFIFRVLKNSLLTGALSKIEMDNGIRNSLAAGIGFLGVVISIVFAISVMGGSFKSITIVAGALSFGAGLGLQNVVSNFVSGIILIFERPIKIGDWVVVNGQEGVVKRINIRATELETWTKSTIIIPNADILSNSLVNMTYDNRSARIEIDVGVGYDSNVEQVQELLLDIAKSTPNVATAPAPYVLFTNLGESSLDFQLRCYTTDISNKIGISNALRAQIINRFRENHIEIPFPQRVVYMHNETPLTIQNASLKEESKPAGAVSKKRIKK